MKIAVLGADTPLGGQIAKEAFHRRNEITVTVSDPEKLDSVKYTVADAVDESLFDAVVEIKDGEVIVRRDGKISSFVLPETVDTKSHRSGAYAETKVNSLGESFANAGDIALAVVDGIVNFSAEKKFVVSEHTPPLPEQPNDGRRRYVAVPHTGIAGKAFRLLMDDAEEYFVHFLADDTMILAKKGEAFTTFSCQCMHCDDEVWMVVFLRGDQCVTLVLDEAQSLATVVYADFMPKKPCVVRHRTLFGAIIPFNGEIPFARHGYTDDLTGSKIIWHYSPYVNITHCYVTGSYIRSSLADMKPLPADADRAAVEEVADRARRWSNLFFEEPALFVRINDHLYIMAFAEVNRNRADPLQGGGDMLLAINTRRMHDYGRGFSRGMGVPAVNLISVYGDWSDMPDPMETARSPYRD